MPELVVIVPSRGRPHAVVELAQAFQETCELEETSLVIVVDDSEPAIEEYGRACRAWSPTTGLAITSSSSMVEALNKAAMSYSSTGAADAYGFMGDDHRPRSKGWDRAYLKALAARPGIVYGNDLLQGENLPTQCAMSTSIIRALGHMAPPVLHHLYVDNYWLTLGAATGCLTYLPEVVVEHLHPVAGKAAWDEGHVRVNQPALYERDKAAFEAYWAERGARDVAAVRAAMGAVAR